MRYPFRLQNPDLISPFRRDQSAKKFLNDGFDVKDTCEKCGFNDYSHFIRTFKNIVGVPPKQYIKRKE